MVIIFLTNSFSWKNTAQRKKKNSIPLLWKHNRLTLSKLNSGKEAWFQKNCCLFSHEIHSNQKDKKTMNFLRELYRQTNHGPKIIVGLLIIKTKADLPKFYRQETGRGQR